MSKNFHKHFWYYLLSVFFQVVGIILVYLFAYNKSIQMNIIVLTTIFYIFWSLLHQYIHHNITAKIVVEYVLIGFLGFTLSLFMFNF